MKARKYMFVLGVMLSCYISVMAQMDSQPAYRRYTTQDGLPQMQAERLWQDARGYIYVGTLSGFVRYDGRRFTPFLKGRRVNIVGFMQVGDEVRALGFFRQWTVGYDDIESGPLDPQGHWLLNNLNAGSLTDSYVLLEDSLEQHRRLCRMTQEGVETLLVCPLLDDMTPDRRLMVDSLCIWIPTSRGLYQVRKADRKAYRVSARGDIYTLLRTDSALLAFTPEGVYKVEASGLQRVATADWSASSYGLTVRQLRSGGIVVADEHTLYLYDSHGITELFSGINLIRDVLVDRWDRVWVASYQGVYYFFRVGAFTTHCLTDGNDIVRAVAVSPTGKVVMGTLNGMVLTADDSPVRSIVSADPQQFYAPSATVVKGEVYMAGKGDIARVTPDGDGAATMQWLGLPRNRYQFVAKAWDTVITGSRNEIFSYDPETAILDTLTTEILHPWCAAEDAEGVLWAGSSSGLFSITRRHEVSKVEYGTQKLVVSTLVADHRGTVFFASADSVFMLRGGRIEPMKDLSSRLAGHEVRSLHISPLGYLVVAAVDGLLVGRLADDYAVCDIRFFDHRNGFTMTEPLKATMAESADGTVWLPGVEQMMSFRPAELFAYTDEATYIRPPLRWWQRWWIWATGLLLLLIGVWLVARWYEKHRNRKRMIRLQREKQERERQIAAIRKKAVDEFKASELARDIVKMTEDNTAERLTLRTASGTIVVDVNDVAYFKGDGNYSQIVTFYDKDTVLLGLGALEKKLPPEIFVRADRSTLVNIHHVSNLLPRQRRCVFRSPSGAEVETTLLAPAFKRLQALL